MTETPEKDPETGLHGNSTFTREVADRILAELKDGRTLRAVCRDEGMPSESTVRTWAVEDMDGFHAQYTRAREIGYMAMADELLDISDDGQNDWMQREAEENEGWTANGEHLQRSRLRVDTRKWLLSKALPKVYGDKVDVTSKGEKIEGITVAFRKPDTGDA